MNACRNPLGRTRKRIFLKATMQEQILMQGKQAKGRSTYGLMLIRFSSIPALSGMMHRNSYFAAMVLAERTRGAGIVRVVDDESREETCRDEAWRREDGLRFRGM